MTQRDKKPLKTAFAEEDSRLGSLAERTSAFRSLNMPSAANDPNKQSEQPEQPELPTTSKVGEEGADKSEAPPTQPGGGLKKAATKKVPLTEEERAERNKQRLAELDAKIAAKDEARRLKGTARSGGPRSELGKAASRKNSIKHGGYSVARSVADGYDKLEKLAEKKFDPNDEFEMGFVRGLAHANWCAQMVDRYQREQFRVAESREPSASEVASAVEFPFGPEYLWLLAKPINELVLWRRVRRLFQVCLADIENAHSLHQASLAKASRTQIPSAQTPRAQIQLSNVGGEKSPVGHALTNQALPRQVASPRHARALELLERACWLFSKNSPTQHNEEGLFDELDRVMNEAANNRGPVAAWLAMRADDSLLVYYWLFRSSNAILLARARLKNQACLEVLNDQGCARARAHLWHTSEALMDEIRRQRENRKGLGRKRLYRKESLAY